MGTIHNVKVAERKSTDIGVGGYLAIIVFLTFISLQSPYGLLAAAGSITIATLVVPGGRRAFLIVLDRLRRFFG